MKDCGRLGYVWLLSPPSRIFALPHWVRNSSLNVWIVCCHLSSEFHCSIPLCGYILRIRLLAQALDSFQLGAIMTNAAVSICHIPNKDGYEWASCLLGGPIPPKYRPDIHKHSFRACRWEKWTHQCLQSALNLKIKRPFTWVGEGNLVLMPLHSMLKALSLIRKRERERDRDHANSSH